MNIVGKLLPLSYLFKKTKNNRILLNSIFYKFKSYKINSLKFKNFYPNFYLTNYNKKTLNCFYNFMIFFLNLNLIFKIDLFKIDKINLYLYLFFNSQYYLTKFFSSNILFFKNTIYSTNKPSILFNFNRNKFLQNVHLNFLIKHINKNPINKYFLKKNIHLRFRFLKLIKIRFGYSLFLSRFFFQNLYKTIDRKFNNNLTIFKLTKSSWLDANLARLTKFSTNFISNDFLRFKSFFSCNLPFNNNLNNLLNVYAINDNILEDSYSFFYLIVYKKKKFYNFFTNNKTLMRIPNVNTANIANTPIFLKKPIFCSYKTYNFSKKQNFLKYFRFFIFNKYDFFFTFFFKPLFFKFLNFNQNLNYLLLNNKFLNHISNQISSTYFYTKHSYITNNNLVPNYKFSYVLKKRIIKIFSYSKFSTTTSLWSYNSLVRFLEFSSGKKVCIKFFNFLINLLDFSEKAQCLIWSQKVKYFRKVLGPRLFLNESIQIIYLALKLKDPYFLSNWMVSTMYKISFWKYKTFLRYIKYVLRYFFWVIFKELKIKGVKFQLKGKVSVAGNARTRTVFQNVGYTSHTTFNNKILYHLNLVKSFTGVMGLKLWIVF